MRALIVDDEPMARRGVVVRLRKYGDIEIIGECKNGLSAVEKILELSPDAVFLDVQMPGMDGFEVLRAIPEDKMPCVVFITAYDQHALRAFDAHAVDYLLKPIDDLRFALAIDRLRKLQSAASRDLATERILKLLGGNSEQFVSRFAVRTGSRIQIVLVEDIVWIRAAGDYAELHTRDRSHLVRETMTSLEQRLDPKSFMRIHRSRIIRAACITSLRVIENREYIVKLADGSEHRTSRTYADKLEAWLGSGEG